MGRQWRWRSARARASMWLCLSGVLLAVPAGAGIWDDAKKLVAGDDQTDTATAALTDDQIGAGLKEALTVGTGRVVEQLGAEGGFSADPAIHIPLPKTLKKVQSALGSVGMASSFDDLELQLNKAAEAATPRAKALFLTAIQDMTLEDVKAIYSGPDDAATRYFREKMSAPLAQEMTPIVDASLSEVGAVQSYDQIMNKYEGLPFAPPVDADLTAYVVDKGMDGIFHYLAKEEAAIRTDPVARSTDLLKKVFGP